MLRALKNSVFAEIRKNDVARKLRGIKNYLENMEIKFGIPEIAGKRALFLAPHPDDESIACGGTIQAIVQSGGEVDVLFLTGGEKGFGPGRTGTKEDGERLRETRKREADAAFRVLGLKHGYQCLPGADGGLHLQDEMGQLLTEWIGTKRYDVFFSPWPYDGHSDHMATFRFFCDALERYRHPAMVWLYEVWAPLLANRIVNIDPFIEKKVAAIRCYDSQVSTGIDYSEKIRALAFYRSIALPEAKYAEAFLVGDKDFALTMARD